MSNKLEITLSRSTIGRNQKQVDTVKTLGLKKVNSSIVVEDTPVIRGMINQVSHLVTVKEA